MQSILEELFFGSIDPNTGSFAPNSEYDKAMKIVCDNEEKLIELLDGREKNLFVDFANAHSTINGATAVEKFAYGFTLGALMMIEVMEKKESIVRE